jgi:phage terminase large subunit GpA-like protein
LEAFADPAIDEIVLTWGTQLGKTTLLGALLCWIAEMDPASAMIACANRQMAHEHYKTKLEPILEACAAVKNRLLPRHRRNLELVDLGSMFIYYAYSGSPATLSSRGIRWLFINEINLWTSDKSVEGDPLKMARDRTKAFRPRHKIFIEGKPTVRGVCRVSAAYEESDRRKYHVPCQHCGAYQELIFGGTNSVGGLKWEKSPDGTSLKHAMETTRYQCMYCEKLIDERHKLRMLRHGVWVAEGQEVVEGRAVGDARNGGHIAGFHLSSLYSTMLTWGNCVEEFLKAHRGAPRDLQAFINGWLAEPWEVAGQRALYGEVMSHKMDYEPGFIPETPAGVICTVDVQQNGLWFLVRAWCNGGTSYLLRYGFVDGFSALERVLQDSYRCVDGRHYQVQATFVDAGYGARASEVYQWCLKTGAVPIKGEHQYRQQAVLSVSKVPMTGQPLWMIDAGIARDQFYERRMRISEGLPGYWGLHRDTGMDFGRAICAWERVEELDKFGRKRLLWKSKDPAHEHLGDLEIYQEAISWFYQFAMRTSAPASPREEREPQTAQRFERSDGRDWVTRR